MKKSASKLFITNTLTGHIHYNSLQQTISHSTHFKCTSINFVKHLLQQPPSNIQGHIKYTHLKPILYSIFLQYLPTNCKKYGKSALDKKYVFCFTTFKKKKMLLHLFTATPLRSPTLHYNTHDHALYLVQVTQNGRIVQQKHSRHHKIMELHKQRISNSN